MPHLGDSHVPLPETSKAGDASSPGRHDSFYQGTGLVVKTFLRVTHLPPFHFHPVVLGAVEGN